MLGAACCRHASTLAGAAAIRASVTTRMARASGLVRVSGRCVLIGGGASLALPMLLRLRRAECAATVVAATDDPWLLVPNARMEDTRRKYTGIWRILRMPITVLEAIWTTTRLTLRCVSLFILLVPLASVYPLACRGERMERAWWTAYIWALLTAGPTFIKLGQWLSTRRDVFSKTFCDRLSVLHTKTRKTRYFRDCEKTLDEVFGEGFTARHKSSVLSSIEPFSIGSGCIAQVYKATMNVSEFERITGRKVPALQGKDTVDIAIKVAEEGVEQQMEMDLSIIRFAARTALTLVPSMKYVDPLGAINQFEMVLRRQVDLRNEAKALEKFGKNFDPIVTGVKFPIVISYTKNVIVETFEEGMYINRLIADEKDQEESHAGQNYGERLQSRQSPAVRRRIALIGARALLKMLFVDNFVHGDLHPGNILIRFNDNAETLPGVHRAHIEEGWFDRVCDTLASLVRISRAPRIRFTDSPYTEDEPTLVVLDTGIAISETPNNLRNLKELFRCIVEKKGYEVGQLLLARTEEHHCEDPEQFCNQVADLITKARKCTSLRLLNISALLSQLFSIVAEHQVKLDSSFTTIVLSMMVLEGFGRSLDPELDLFQCARPYLLNVMV
ncbi:hypothetical protein PENTCL1PPCAC_12603 [Pristionchus entomophagus]|uniref:ABC1 atypical kinase-like domain-containing protein n=1 Tax=Pristionchus entomophagus TaxID=358040 RepID=A0AAV5T8H4_9BILA|nr:hypothetical protein PENTCL1PPCAC_12603 [Pristionchus entomophagus]